LHHYYIHGGGIKKRPKIELIHEKGRCYPVKKYFCVNLAENKGVSGLFSGYFGLNYRSLTMAKKDNVKVRELHVNKVYQVIGLLEPGARKRLIRYLHSPFFNQSRVMSRLCEILINYAEAGKEGFDRHAVWQKLSPDEPYDDVNFRKSCSDLLKIIESFMAYEAFTRDDTKTALATYDYVVRSKIEPLYNSTFRQAKTLLDHQPYRSVDYYFNAYSLERHFYNRMDFDVQLDVRANIEEIAYNLDLFYWIQKLKLSSAVLSQRKTIDHRYALNFVEEMVAYLGKFPIEEVPELAIYYYSFFTLYEDDNLAHYYNLRRILDQYGRLMPREDAIEIFDSALHYCTGKINQGKQEFLQEYFDLFESAIEQSVFLVKGELAPWRFNNMVGAALRLRKLSWAEAFIEKYKQHLPTDARKNTYSFNLARVYRYQGKFDKVLKLLHNLEYPDIGYNLITKTMLVITYYELDEFDALNSFLESFRAFLNRNKKVPYRIHHLNLIKYARQLIRLVPGDHAAVEKLRAEITREKASTVNHEWLLEKLGQIK
jgi:hypothetical protein